MSLTKGSVSVPLCLAVISCHKLPSFVLSSTKLGMSASHASHGEYQCRTWNLTYVIDDVDISTQKSSCDLE